jgi:hypothetical protein
VVDGQSVVINNAEVVRWSGPLMLVSRGRGRFETGSNDNYTPIPLRWQKERGVGVGEVVGVHELRCRTYRIRRNDIDTEGVGRISEKQGDETKLARKVATNLARNYFGSCYPTRSNVLVLSAQFSI